MYFSHFSFQNMENIEVLEPFSINILHTPMCLTPSLSKPSTPGGYDLILIGVSFEGSGKKAHAKAMEKKDRTSSYE